jgi:hypothetical protein
MQKQKTKDKRVIIYDKWEFIEGLIILFGAGYVLLVFLLIFTFSSIIDFWLPLALGTALGMYTILVFNEIGWYVNIILTAIIAIGDGAFSVPFSAMSPPQIGIVIFCIGIGFFGISFGFSTMLLSRSLKKQAIK